LPVYFQQSTRRYWASSPLLLDFAPGKVYLTLYVTIQVVGSYSAFSPLPSTKIFKKNILVLGGIFSVALSIPAASSRLRLLSGAIALWSPDFPTSTQHQIF